MFLNFHLNLKASKESKFSKLEYNDLVSCNVNTYLYFSRRRMLCMSNKQGTKFHPSSNFSRTYKSNTPRCNLLWNATGTFSNNWGSYNQLYINHNTTKNWQAFKTSHNGPEGHPNNFSQPAWCLRELFFWSDLSWSRADLFANSYVISMHFSLFGGDTTCTCYISHVGIEHIIQFRIICINNNIDICRIRPYRFSTYLLLFIFSIFE